MQNKVNFKSAKAKCHGFTYEKPAANGKLRYYATVLPDKGKNNLCRYYFLTAEHRNKHIEGIIKGRIEKFARTQEHRKKQNVPCELKVNDILYTSWGYDQTNVEFYKVLEVIGKRKVKLIEIGYDLLADGPNGMSGKVFPEVLKEIGEPFEKMVTNGSTVKIHSFAYAHKWDGEKAVYCSWYA